MAIQNSLFFFSYENGEVSPYAWYDFVRFEFKNLQKKTAEKKFTVKTSWLMTILYESTAIVHN